MEIKTNGYIAHFYQWTYGIDTEQLEAISNFCIFFWMFMVALLLSPVTIISFPLLKTFGYSKSDTGIFIKIAITTFYIVAAFFIFLFITDSGFRLGVYAFLIISTLVILGCVLLSGSVWLYIHKITAKNSKVYNLYSELKTITVIKKDSFLNSYCPKLR